MRVTKGIIILIFLLAFPVMGFANFFLGVQTGTYMNNFWSKREIYEETGDDADQDKFERLYNIYNGFSVGLDISYKILESPEIKGSRFYINTDIDYYFIGMSAYFRNYEPEPFPVNLSSALNLSIFIGGSVPKTDVVWGIGELFFFVFPNYVEGKSYWDLRETFYFFTVPTIMVGYEFFLPNEHKLSPQLRVGVNLNPYFSRDVKPHKLDDLRYYMGGFYIDLSLCYYFKLF